MIPDLDELSGRYLCLGEREEIAAGVSAGLNNAEIGRHRSNVGQEIKRNQTLHRDPPPPRADGLAHRPGTKPGVPPPPRERLRYRAVVAQLGECLGGSSSGDLEAHSAGEEPGVVADGSARASPNPPPAGTKALSCPSRRSLTSQTVTDAARRAGWVSRAIAVPPPPRQITSRPGSTS